jgi:ribosome maturation factor RimP
MSNRIEDRVRKVVTPFLEQNNCRLWDVVFEKEGAYHYLRVLFDGEDGNPLDIELCEKLTLPLNKLIDGENLDPIDIVEVGSPGITRRLRHPEHFEFCKGKRVRVMRRTDNGKTESIAGVMQGYNFSAGGIATTKSITVSDEEIELKKCLRITLEEQMR